MQACEDELDLSFIRVGHSPLTVSAWSAQHGQREMALCFSPSSPASVPCPSHHHLLHPPETEWIREPGGQSWKDCCPRFLHFTGNKPRPREGACSGHTAGSLRWVFSEVCVFPSCWNITVTWVAENNRCLFSCSSGGWKSGVRVPARPTFL